MGVLVSTFGCLVKTGKQCERWFTMVRKSLTVVLAVLLVSLTVGCDELTGLISEYGYDFDAYGYEGYDYGSGYDDWGMYGGDFYSNPYLGTAVSYAGGDGYIALGDGTFY